MSGATEEPGPRRVLEDAAARGLEVVLVERGPAGSLAEAARLLGVEPGDIVKSMVVKRRDGTFLFAEIPGDRQISWPKLRALAGANKLALPDAETALAATGTPGEQSPRSGHRHPGPSTPTSASGGARSSSAEAPTAFPRAPRATHSSRPSTRSWETSPSPLPRSEPRPS